MRAYLSNLLDTFSNGAFTQRTAPNGNAGTGSLNALSER